MPQRKKTQNKQNSKIIKKTTLQEINYTEELRIPASIAHDTKQMGRSIQLKKSNSRKPVSRKSQCISVKQSQPPLKLKDLLKQFNSLKLISSKSKSPMSNKQSRSKCSKGKNKKKTNVYATHSHHHTKMNTQINSRVHSQVNLTAKLEKTIKKLKQTDYFIDEEDSDIPFVSTSSAFTPQQRHKLEVIDNQQEEDINIRQMRMFCKSGTFNKNSQNLKIHGDCPYIKRSVEILKGNIYETMARKIQRAWRRYRTHKLITMYSQNNFYHSIFDQFREGNRNQQRINNTSNSGQNSQNSDGSHSDFIIQSDQLYPEQLQHKKITYISNLQQSDNKSEIQSDELYHKQIKSRRITQKQSGIHSQVVQKDMMTQQQQLLAEQIEQQSDQQLKALKQQWLQKWDESVELLKDCHNNPKEQKRIMNQLMLRFEANKQLLSKMLRKKQQQSDEDGENIMDLSQGHNQNIFHKSKREQSNSESLEEENEEGQSSDQRKDMKLQIRQGEQMFVPHSFYQPQPYTTKISRHRRKSSSHSSGSIKMMEEEFNSKKYIQYLDSDMYPRQQNYDIKRQKRLIEQPSTISQKKQDLLLMKLKADPTRITNRNSLGRVANFDQNILQLQGIRSRLSYRSNSELSCESNQFLDYNEDNKHNQANPRNRNKELRKSSSQKVFKFLSSQRSVNQFATIQQMEMIEIGAEKQDQSDKDKQIQEQGQGSEENVEDLLTKFVQKQLNEFDFQQNLQSVTNGAEQFDRCYSENQLVQKIAELKKLRDSDSDQEQNSQYIVERGCNSDNDGSQESPVLHRTNGQLHKINIQDSDRHIDSDEEQEGSQENRILLNRNMSNQISDIAEKAEGISQVLFHQILIEVLKDMAKFPTTVLQKFKAYALQNKSSEQASITVNSNNRPRRAQQRTKKNGFLTNQAQIRKFTQQMIKGLLNQEPHIFKNLEKSTGPSALEMLKYMHQSQDEEIMLEDEQDDPSVMVLPNWIFDVFWSRKAPTIKYQIQSILLEQQRQQQRQQYLKSLNKIFYRSLFDCLNECLDFQRNYGPVGKPFPWKKSAQFEHTKTYSDILKSVKNAQKRLLQISATYCGIIIERDEMISLCGSQEYLDQVQEDRLSRMLAQDLVEGEDRWIFYDDEETQLLVEIGNSLYFEIIWECVNQLYIMEAVRPKV